LIHFTRRSVTGWTNAGGSFVGTSRQIPKSKEAIGQIVATIKKHNLKALIMIGGFEGLKLSRERFFSISEMFT
jgi:6-phosphofructokinase